MRPECVQHMDASFTAAMMYASANIHSKRHIHDDKLSVTQKSIKKIITKFTQHQKIRQTNINKLKHNKAKQI